MKKLLKWGGAALMITALVLMFGACPPGEDELDEKEGASGVDFKNYTTDSTQAFMVRNNTSVRLVAFKGSLAADAILGGIPASAQNHGIKKNTSLLNTTQSFSMILITEEVYNKNKSNLAALELTPFTRVYVYYNASGDNTVLYDISSRLGGDKIIEIGNNSKLNVEIRLGGINGETIGYAPAGVLTTKLYVTDGDFNLFPVFKRYNALRDVVETIYPRGKTGNPWFQPLAIDENTNSVYFDIKPALDAVGNSTTGVAMLSINNQTSGAIRLVKGNTVIRSSTGISYFNSGSPKVFTVEMQQVPGSTGTFATSQDISSYKVGPTANEVAVKGDDGKSTFTVLTDYMYTVNVTGSVNDGDLKAVIFLKTDSTDEKYPKPVKISLDDLDTSTNDS